MSRISSVLDGLWRRVAARLPAMHHRRWAALLVTAVVVLAAATVVARRGPSISQPIAFNHLKHTTDLGLDCEFCHQYVRTGAHAGLPEAETCAMCHSVPQGQSREAARLTEMLTSGEPLRFNKLFRLADHVFYTHRRHVGIAGLECVNCHDGIADTERPPARPLVRITMRFCLDCHRERGETVDCVRCHR